MKRIYEKWIKIGTFGLFCLFTFVACEDDHYDTLPGTPTSSIWENLASRSDLSSFRAILEKTKVTRNENDTKSTITYKDLLSSGQNFTVWAPVDGSFDATTWLAELENGDNVDVEKEFVRNHLARFSYPASTPDEKRILMMNKKVNTFNYLQSPFTFKNKELIVNEQGTYNTPSKNGSLYVINGVASYFPNVFEFLSKEPAVTDLSEYVHSYDSTYFSASASTPGETVNGEIQYVDSVMVTTNRLLGSQTSNEDSLYVAIYPKNEAWATAQSVVKNYNVYPKTLKYYGTTYETRNTATTESMNADSLQLVRTNSMLFDNMFFSLNRQPGFDPNTASLETVSNFINSADSLVGSSNTVIKAPYCQQIFDGATPEEVSNGYVYVVDNYSYTPSKVFHPDVYINYRDCVNRPGAYLDYNRTKNVVMNDKKDDYSLLSYTWASSPGVDSLDVGSPVVESFGYFKTNSGNKPQVSIKLLDILSGTYDIYLVVAPEVLITPTSARPTRFQATLNYLDENGTEQTLKAWNGDEVTTSAKKVDSLLVFENFKFPTATKGLQSSKVNVSLTVTSTVALRENKTYTQNLCLVRVVLVAKDN